MDGFDFEFDSTTIFDVENVPEQEQPLFFYNPDVCPEPIRYPSPPMTEQQRADLRESDFYIFLSGLDEDTYDGYEDMGKDSDGGGETDDRLTEAPQGDEGDGKSLEGDEGVENGASGEIGGEAGRQEA